MFFFCEFCFFWVFVCLGNTISFNWGVFLMVVCLYCGLSHAINEELLNLPRAVFIFLHPFFANLAFPDPVS